MLDFTTFAQERTRDFTGRVWLFERIDRWLASDEGSRCFIIIGEPGSGKTAIAARLFEYSTGSIEINPAPTCIRPGFLSAAHFCSARDVGWTDPLLFVQSISRQLADRYPDFNAALLEAVGVHVTGTASAETNVGELVGLYIKNLNISGTPKPSSVFVQLVRSPLIAMFAKNPLARVTLLVDGLDQAEAAANQGDSIASLLAGTADFPGGFRFFVTTRPEPSIERGLRRLGSGEAEVSLSEGDGESLSKADVGSYVAAAFSSTLADAASRAALDAIAEKAGANFLYARFALRMLDATPPDKIDAVFARLPPGLEALYLEYLDRLPEVRTRWANLYRPILGTLVVAREPLTLTELTALTATTPPLEETTVLDGVTALRQFLDAQGAPRTYRLYHQSFADFLEGESAEQYRCKASLFHAAVARAYDGKPLDGYAWRWLTYHLAKAGRTDGLRRLLLDVSYLRGKLDETEAIGLIYDFDYVPGDADLRSIQGAIRLCASIISRDPAQFTSQLVGRLLPYMEMPVLREFCDSLARAAPTPWLRALTPTLAAPGEAVLFPLHGHTEDVTSVAVTPPGKLAVSTSYDGSLFVWDTERGVRIAALRTAPWSSGRAVAVTADGSLTAVGYDDKTILLWDVAADTIRQTMRGHTDSVRAVTFADGGATIMSGSDDRSINIWDTASGRLVQTLRAHEGAVTALAVTPDRRYLISAGADKVLHVWDRATGTAIRKLSGHAWPVRAVAATPDGLGCVSGSEDGTLRLWDLQSGATLRVMRGHTGWVLGVAVSPDGTRAVSCGDDATVRVWDLATGANVETRSEHAASVTGIALTGDGLRAVSCSNDKTLMVWSLAGGAARRDVERHRGAVRAVTAARDTPCAVSASNDATLRAWAPRGTGSSRVLTGHKGAVTDVAVTPDGRLAISASWDRTLIAWDLANACALRTLSGHTAAVNRVAFTADGARALSCSDDRRFACGTCTMVNAYEPLKVTAGS